MKMVPSIAQSRDLSTTNTWRRRADESLPATWPAQCRGPAPSGKFTFIATTVSVHSLHSARPSGSFLVFCSQLWSLEIHVGSHVTFFFGSLPLLNLPLCGKRLPWPTFTLVQLSLTRSRGTLALIKKKNTHQNQQHRHLQQRQRKRRLP